MISPRSLWTACKYLQKIAKGLQKVAKVCKILQKSAKVCKILQKVAKVCKSFNGKFCIPYLIKSNPTVSNPTVFSSYHSLSRPIRSKPLPAGSRAEPSCLMWEI